MKPSVNSRYRQGDQMMENAPRFYITFLPISATDKSAGPCSSPTFAHDFSLGRPDLQQVALYQIPILFD
jgi:hypothetical protein